MYLAEINININEFFIKKGKYYENTHKLIKTKIKLMLSNTDL